ncbi:hypothetical protein ATY41_09425 [Leifsonia xyli subsp. xyli]|uniref:DUF7882 domain-containing protein n=2 Tax=Leifsonia xyli subsp. xyli TaxID=59736 RepID=Q6ACU8_LEIXX|nr:hypothetical protein [Leifsonia xyli]AAT89795.1 hypothetical protein Lxx20970 [Leifsonia xyli subsp. xyli str. CTCB07]ODA90634.1 hypothetical protein ATY41_09425 [Leifsonia xyli subsp. xyli]
MGTLQIGSTARIELDDTELEQLRIAMGVKLRCREMFAVSWTEQTQRGASEQSVLVGPGQPLLFSFDSCERPKTDRTRVGELLGAANTLSGMRI